MYEMLIVWCAKYLIFVSAAAVLLSVFFSRLWKRLVVSVLACVAFSVALGKVAGLLWYDTLPFVQNGTAPLFEHAANNGFPSDHVLVAGALASALLPYNRPLGALLWAAALLVGLARVAAGVHHIIDIAVAVGIALVVGAAVEYTLRKSAILTQ